MSIRAANSAVHGQTAHHAEAPSAGPSDDSFVDNQGRRWTRTLDPVTGNTILAHHGKQVSPDGSARVTLGIEIVIRPDGSAQRQVAERLHVAGGAFRETLTQTSFNAAGLTTAERTTSVARQGDTSLREEESTEFSQGQPVRRTLHSERSQQQRDPSGASAESRQLIDGVWENGGKPLTETTVPTLRFDETVRYVDPTGGITRKDPRTLTTHRVASGKADALQWEPMQLTVRWEGPDDDYIERVLELALDATGNTVPGAKPKVISEVNNQELHDKVLDKARIYGGFGSWVSAMIGLRLVGNSSSRVAGIGRALVVGGAGMAAAETAAFGYGIAQQRNDSDFYSAGMSLWDSVTMGALAWAVTRRPNNAATRSLGHGPMMHAIAPSIAGVAAAVPLAAHGAMVLRRRNGEGPGGVTGQYGAVRDPGFERSSSVDIAPLQLDKRAGQLTDVADPVAAPSVLDAAITIGQLRPSAA